MLVRRGDTLVEVLFAVAVFSLVAVGALGVMNQGSATSQRSLELTLVQEEIDAQAATLRFVHDAYTAVYYSGITYDTTDAETSPAETWYVLTNEVTSTSASEYGTCPAYDSLTPSSYTPPSGSFFMSSTSATAIFAADSAEQFAWPLTWAQIGETDGGLPRADGLWIEGVRSGDDIASNGYIDFHIRACWDSVGVSQPMTLGTIVRLYDPRG